MRRGARFEIIDDDSDEETLRDADYIVLDVPSKLLAQLLEKVQVAHDIQKTDTEPEDGRNVLWTIHLYVKPRHPSTVGPTKSDGSPAEVTWQLSLLAEDIPKE